LPGQSYPENEKKREEGMGLPHPPFHVVRKEMEGEPPLLSSRAKRKKKGGERGDPVNNIFLCHSLRAYLPKEKERKRIYT